VEHLANVGDGVCREPREPRRVAARGDHQAVPATRDLHRSVEPEGTAVASPARRHDPHAVAGLREREPRGEVRLADVEASDAPGAGDRGRPGLVAVPAFGAVVDVTGLLVDVPEAEVTQPQGARIGVERGDRRAGLRSGAASATTADRSRWASPVASRLSAVTAPAARASVLSCGGCGGLISVPPQPASTSSSAASRSRIVGNGKEPATLLGVPAPDAMRTSVRQPGRVRPCTASSAGPRP
jgi:hypothetical protein